MSDKRNYTQLNLIPRDAALLADILEGRDTQFTIEQRMYANKRKKEIANQLTQFCLELVKAGRVRKSAKVRPPIVKERSVQELFSL
jgi:hypothetical protein